MISMSVCLSVCLPACILTTTNPISVQLDIAGCSGSIASQLSHWLTLVVNSWMLIAALLLLLLLLLLHDSRLVWSTCVTVRVCVRLCFWSIVVFSSAVSPLKKRFICCVVSWTLSTLRSAGVVNEELRGARLTSHAAIYWEHDYEISLLMTTVVTYAVFRISCSSIICKYIYVYIYIYIYIHIHMPHTEGKRWRER